MMTIRYDKRTFRMVTDNCGTVFLRQFPKFPLPQLPQETGGNEGEGREREKHFLYYAGLIMK